MPFERLHRTVAYGLVISGYGAVALSGDHGIVGAPSADIPSAFVAADGSASAAADGRSRYTGHLQ